MLHELAHAMTSTMDGQSDGHGGFFMGVYVRLLGRYTPKHGSGLEMAETELSVLTTQCLDRRIPDEPTLIEEIAAWQQRRNQNHAKADWQFTTADARVKLRRLYPVI